MQHHRYQQIYTYAHTIPAYPRDSLTYMRQFAIQTMDYGDAAMTNMLSSYILPVEELRNMLRHKESQLPSIMHLPRSSDNTLHFYWYLKTHVLTADGQFLPLINVLIQGRAQQLQIYGIFNLPVPHGEISAQYKINIKYVVITYDETQEVMIYQATILDMSSCKWTILQNRCTIPSSPKSTILYSSLICQERSRNGSAVFPINISHTTCIYTLYNHIKPLDSHFNPHYARISFNNDLPW